MRRKNRREKPLAHLSTQSAPLGRICTRQHFQNGTVQTAKDVAQQAAVEQRQGAVSNTHWQAAETDGLETLGGSNTSHPAATCEDVPVPLRLVISQARSMRNDHATQESTVVSTLQDGGVSSRLSSSAQLQSDMVSPNIPLYGESLSSSSSHRSQPSARAHAGTMQRRMVHFNRQQVEDLRPQADMQDENGLVVLSRGSKNHFLGQCRPCYACYTPAGCPDGPLCNYCHFRHSETKMKEATMYSAKASAKRAAQRQAEVALQEEAEAQAAAATVPHPQTVPRPRGMLGRTRQPQAWVPAELEVIHL